MKVQGRVLYASDAYSPRLGYVFQDHRLLPWRTVNGTSSSCCGPPTFRARSGTASSTVCSRCLAFAILFTTIMEIIERGGLAPLQRRFDTWRAP